MEIKDLTGLQKPLSKLIASVSNGIGAIYEPTRIRRKARADSDAMLTLAEGEIQVEELKRRAVERVTYTELRRQRNIEQIVTQAVTELPEAVDDKPANEDWIAQFFNLSQDVGDAEMQILWARILSGEVAQPGTYSLRTLQIVNVLSKDDAQMFSRYCSYIWLLSNGVGCRYTNKETDKFLSDNGIGSSERQHLQNLGLMYSSGLISSSGSQTAISSRDEPFEITYFGRKYVVKQFLNSNESAIVLPEYLTDVGNQLFPISGAQPNEQYLEMLIKVLKDEKLNMLPLS
jgi:uncharacterized repeat protein (TIGR03899 family)